MTRIRDLDGTQIFDTNTIAKDKTDNVSTKHCIQYQDAYGKYCQVGDYVAIALDPELPIVCRVLSLPAHIKQRAKQTQPEYGLPLFLKPLKHTSPNHPNEQTNPIVVDTSGIDTSYKFWRLPKIVHEACAIDLELWQAWQVRIGAKPAVAQQELSPAELFWQSLPSGSIKLWLPGRLATVRAVTKPDSYQYRYLELPYYCLKSLAE